MVKYRRMKNMDSEEPRAPSRLSIVSRNSSNADCHSQFSEEEFQRDLHKKPNVVGPGGVPLPRQAELNAMLDGDQITVMCFTWNIAAKPVSGLNSLSELFAKVPHDERQDVIAIALQELPTSTIRFHNDMVAIVQKALDDTHRVYCWVRKWSQMVLIFIRKKLSLYASYPEYQFVATKTLASPFRTKGAIGVCFRLLQTTCVFIACHLTHGKVKKRISDYAKLSKLFDFRMLKTSSEVPDTPMKQADFLFWFGDLNFRIQRKDAAEIIKSELEEKLFKEKINFDFLLHHDELTVEKTKGLIFHGFREGIITFPPTHKFYRNTNQFVSNRIPSYTDRVLYWSRDPSAIYPIRYDCVWALTVSDHKPVYCTFKMRVLRKRNDASGSVYTNLTSSNSATSPSAKSCY
uniref:IPPc domain-containing protein n=1 Tax=Bursaphelenchus xylophilus TaxID=6326 RepID=A0A1I7RPX1_BURXY